MPKPTNLGQGRIPPALEYASISANSTVTIKTHGGGVIHTITICQKGATANTLKLTLDGVDTPLFDTTANVASITLDVGFVDSATMTLATGTAAVVMVSFA